MNAPTNENPASGATERGLGKQHRQSHPTKPPRKWQRVLRAFVDGWSGNRFQAERDLADHCLHSTVSEIQSRGVIIHRQLQTVSGYQGMATQVMRYWLAPGQHTLALKLLGDMEASPREQLALEAFL